MGLQLHGGIGQGNAPDPSQVEPSADDRQMVADFECFVASTSWLREHSDDIFGTHRREARCAQVWS